MCHTDLVPPSFHVSEIDILFPSWIKRRFWRREHDQCPSRMRCDISAIALFEDFREEDEKEPE